MALTLLAGKGRNGTNILDHHRNPSGFRNKVAWLLSKSNRDVNALRELFFGKVCKGPEKSKMWWSWVNAYAVAKFKIEELAVERRLTEVYREKCLELKMRPEKRDVDKNRD